ncbi:cyclin-like protein interacting with PHO85 [Sporothrix epigloea]|uniref:Cyclin-like protein interacting with PHO85 n=1 Tax=Sporothrix epigloea TaxID=1892477 RepID=A0ABP0DPW9_9PEZI
MATVVENGLSSSLHSRAQTPGITTAHQFQQQQSVKHHFPSSSKAQLDTHMQREATENRIEALVAHQPVSPPLSSFNSFSSPPTQIAKSAVPGSFASKSAKATVRIPTPPDSSSPSSPQHAQDGYAADVTSSSESFIMATSHGSVSPSAADSAATAPASSLPGFPDYVLPDPPLLQEVPEQRTQRTIIIRDLHHIQTLAQTNGIPSSGNLGNDLGDSNSTICSPTEEIKYEISAMPISDIIETVSALLTKITTANDHQHDALHRNASQQRQAQAHNEGSEHSFSGSPFTASVLAFHGKNVPAITILSYLTRFHKYCPTTYEVFLSLLVYFDRMTERVNELVVSQQQEHERRAALQQATMGAAATPFATPTHVVRSGTETDADMHDANGDYFDVADEGLAGSGSSDASSDDDEKMYGGGSNHIRRPRTVAKRAVGAGEGNGPDALFAATYFVVDSYNIHRLIIAGVTCASKFFSDVFYTNARYAKVGGLPLAELNHLELQFLILNDFRLAISIEDLEAYATMLVEFYMREVIGTRPRPSPPALSQTTTQATDPAVIAP